MSQTNRTNHYPSNIHTRRAEARAHHGYGERRRFSGYSLVAAGLIGLVGIGVKTHEDRKQEEREIPTVTTLVTVEDGDNLQTLQDREGYGDNNPSMVRDKVVTMNGGAHIEPGDQAILVDYPGMPKEAVVAVGAPPVPPNTIP